MKASCHASTATNLARVAIGCSIWLLAAHSAFVNSWVESVWDVLRHSALFKHDSFEPLLVTASVAVFSVFFRTLDLLPRLTARWRIQKSDDVSHWKIERGERYRRSEMCVCVCMK